MSQNDFRKNIQGQVGMPSLSVPKLSVAREVSMEDVPSFGDMPKGMPRETASMPERGSVNSRSITPDPAAASHPTVISSTTTIKTVHPVSSETAVKPVPYETNVRPAAGLKPVIPLEDTLPGTSSPKPVAPLPTPPKAEPVPVFHMPPQDEETHTPRPMAREAFPTIPAGQEEAPVSDSGKHEKAVSSVHAAKNVTVAPVRTVENVALHPVRPIVGETSPVVAPVENVTSTGMHTPNVTDTPESMTTPQPVPTAQAVQEDAAPAVPVENKPTMKEDATGIKTSTGEADSHQPSGKNTDGMKAEPQNKPIPLQEPQPKTYTPMRVEGVDATCTFDGHQIVILNHGRKARKSRVASTVTPIDSVVKAKLLWDDEDHAAFCLQVLRRNGKPNTFPTHLEDVEADMYAFQAEDPGKAAAMVKAIDEAKPNTPQPLEADPYRRKHWYANPWMWTTILLILTATVTWLFSTYTIQDGHVENRSMVSETMRDESNVSRKKAEEEADAADKLSSLGAGSRIDLINQLENLGCSSAAATGAVDSSGRDWNAQAVEWLGDWMQGNPDAGQDAMLNALTIEGFDDEQANNAIQQVAGSDSQPTTDDAQDDGDTTSSNVE